MHPGRRLGDFILREKLGEGGYGMVFRAEQTTLSRDSVVKVLQARHGGNELTRQRFLREARLASRLDHPHAAHVYAFGVEDDGTMWLAMELVRGATLAHWLAQHGPLELGELVPFFDQVCDVVASAHEARIVHRDLKPANIMVLERGGRLTPKLLDFGLARLTAERPEPAAPGAGGDAASVLTQSGALVGSPHYMAPEQWEDGLPVDERSDQYALGIVVYECLRGRVPFEGSTMEVARAHLDAALPPVGQAAVDGVLRRATAKRPDQRFPSVVAFAAALREAAGLVPEAPPPPLAAALRAALATAPQPFAETLVALEAARNLHQALEAARVAELTLWRYLAVLALASFTRLGATPAPALAERLRALHRHAPESDDWRELVADAVAPFAERPDAHPLPELVAGVARLPTTGDSGAGAEDSVRARLARRVAALAELVACFADVLALSLAIPRGGGVELLVGPRRIARAATVVVGRTLPEGRAVLLDRQHRPLLVLAPLLQVAPPAPGADDEVFLLAGPGGHGACLVAAPRGFERQDEAVWTWLRRLLDVAPEETSGGPDGAPYLGLRPYTAADADRYHGREAQVASFVNRLRVSPFLVVTGPSGAGKSSFVMAGVVPALGPGWGVAVLRPGPDPGVRLARELAAAPPGPLLVVVDQLEELFTMTRDPAARVAFTDELVAAAGERVRVVATLRDDFLARAQSLPALAERLSAALQILSTPAAADLERILVEPARRAGYVFEDPELPGEIARELVDQPAALALLSFTAAAFWERRDRHFRRLTRGAYEALGGVGGALARHAEGTLAELPPAEQRLVREAFRHLVSAEGTREAMTLEELEHVLGGGRAVIEKLLAARLLVADDQRIEIAHEALVSSWPRLERWRREDAEGARLRDQLRAAARAWHERGQPRGLLWRGEALAEYRLWRARTGMALTHTEESFAAASLRDAARGQRLRRSLVGGAFLALTACSLLLYTFARRAQDRYVSGLAEQGRQLMLADDASRGLAYLGAAFDAGARDAGTRYLIGRGVEQLGAQRLVLPHEAWVRALHVTRAGNVIVGTRDGKLAVWDGQGTLLRRLQAHAGTVGAAQVSRDERLIATGGWDGKIAVWRIDDGARLQLFAYGSKVRAVAFSTDGSFVAGGGDTGRVGVWDVGSGAPVGELELGGRVAALAFVADGTLVAGGENGRLAAWREGGAARMLGDGEPIAAISPAARGVLVARGRRVVVYDGELAVRGELAHPRLVDTVLVDEGGTQILTGGADGVARLWDGEHLALSQQLVGHRGDVLAVAFCSEGRVATAGADGTVRTWDGANGVALGVFEGHRDRVTQVACRGDRVYAGGNDGTVRAFGAEAPQVRARWSVSPQGLAYLSVSAERIAVSGVDRLVTIWDRQRRARLFTLPFTGPVNTAKLVAGGRLLTSRYGGKVAELWDLEGRRVLLTIAGHDDVITSAAASPDGAWIATSSFDGTARLWDGRSGAAGHVLRGHEGQVFSVSFSPDGQRVVTSGEDRTARIWDVASGRERVVLRGHGSAIQSSSFDPSGTRIVTASNDRTAKVWDAASGKLLLSLEGATGYLRDARFSPAGELIVTVGVSDAVQVWDAASGLLVQVLRGHAGAVGDAIFTPGDTLLTIGLEDGKMVEWNAAAYRGDAGPLRRFLDCRVPFRLQGSALLPRPVDDARPCAAP